MACLIEGYKLCARTEGKSQNTIAIVTNSVNYFHDFLASHGLPTDVRYIGLQEIRAFILHVQGKRCFSNQPFSRPQGRRLSSYTINCYLRSIRAFWSWLISEEIINHNPFLKVKLPKPIRKVIPSIIAASGGAMLLDQLNVEVISIAPNELTLLHLTPSPLLS